LKVQRNSIY